MKTVQYNIPDNSLAGAFSGFAGKADTRDKRGLVHPFKTLLILMTIGYLMGVMTFRGVYYLFNPVGIFLDPEKKKARKGKYNSKSSRKGKGKKTKMSPEEQAKWKADRARCMSEAEGEAAEILKDLQEVFPFIKKIPHYSTMSRAFKGADTRTLVCALYLLFARMIPEGQRRHLAIDGKALRAAMNRALENHSLYVVNVFDTAARIFLVSFQVGDKKNEASTLMKEMDNILLGKPSMVTMDAAGTQTELIRLMVKLGSEYVLPVKSNQKKLRELMRKFFKDQALDLTEDFDFANDLKGHGEDEQPSTTIKPAVIRITEEMNGKAGQYTQLDEDDAEQEGEASGSQNAQTQTTSEEEKAQVESASKNEEAQPISEAGENKQDTVEGETQAESTSKNEEAQPISEAGENKQDTVEGESQAESTSKSEETQPISGSGEENQATMGEESQAESTPNENQSKEPGGTKEDGVDGKEEEETDVIISMQKFNLEYMRELFPSFLDAFPLIPKEDLSFDPSNETLVAVEIGGKYKLMARNADRYECIEVAVCSSPEILNDDLFQKRFETVQTLILVNRYRLQRSYSKGLGKHWELVINSTPYISNALLSAEEALHLIVEHWRVLSETFPYHYSFLEALSNACLKQGFIER